MSIGKLDNRQVFASQNLHALLKAIFGTYAADLRHRYKSQIIRNAAVFDSAIRECSRLGYIELVNSRKDMAGVPALIARRLKRVKHFPIWIMGPNFPDEPLNLLAQLRPSMKGDKVIWHHHPSQTAQQGVTGREKCPADHVSCRPARQSPVDLLHLPLGEGRQANPIQVACCGTQDGVQAGC